MTPIFTQKMLPNPRLTIDGISRFDISQGILGKSSLFIELTLQPTEVNIEVNIVMPLFHPQGTAGSWRLWEL